MHVNTNNDNDNNNYNNNNIDILYMLIKSLKTSMIDHEVEVTAVLARAPDERVI